MDFRVKKSDKATYAYKSVDKAFTTVLRPGENGVTAIDIAGRYKANDEFTSAQKTEYRHTVPLDTEGGEDGAPEDYRLFFNDGRFNPEEQFFIKEDALKTRELMFKTLVSLGFDPDAPFTAVLPALNKSWKRLVLLALYSNDLGGKLADAPVMDCGGTGLKALTVLISSHGYACETALKTALADGAWGLLDALITACYPPDYSLIDTLTEIEVNPDTLQKLASFNDRQQDLVGKKLCGQTNSAIAAEGKWESAVRSALDKVKNKFQKP